MEVGALFSALIKHVALANVAKVNRLNPYNKRRIICDMPHAIDMLPTGTAAQSM
tara:strand:- start:2659 stop:2820 length:162 start_codon:yes stop_codon:yes gene_type:complete